MRLIRYTATIAAALVLAMATAAEAAPVTIGSPLIGPAEEGSASGGSGTYANLTLSAPARTTSPVTGAVVSWSILNGEGPFSLRVLRPVGGPSFTGVGSSTLVAGSGGLQTFPTAIPIQAGDTIGLDIADGNKIGVFRTDPADVAAVWVPPLGEGLTLPYTVAAPKNEVAFNAVVQPAPTVTSVAPNSGSFKGGASVTITGTDFAGVSAVTIGGVAASFTPVSEAQLTAIVPRRSKPETTGVTVTTIAGTSPAAAAAVFTYKACVVPKLKQRTLKAAKKKLKKAGCKVGKVTKVNGATAKSGKVTKQGKGVGKKLAPGSKVSVTLG